MTAEAEALQAAKQAIRAEMRKRRAEVSPEARLQAGTMAAAMLFDRRGLALFPRFHCFASYLSTPEEFPTEEIHVALFQAQALLAVPRYTQLKSTYGWAPITPSAPLRKGPHGIWEPAARLWAQAGAFEVVLVPGLAFDLRGGRIGYGAGIYDRLLAQLRPSVLRVGLAYDCQVVEKALPQAPHDRPMDYLVTESHWIDCRRARAVRREHRVFKVEEGV